MFQIVIGSPPELLPPPILTHCKCSTPDIYKPCPDCLQTALLALLSPQAVHQLLPHTGGASWVEENADMVEELDEDTKNDLSEGYCDEEGGEQDCPDLEDEITYHGGTNGP